MTPAQLLALMATMHCQSMVMDIPERRETVVQTVCVKVEVVPSKEEPKPVVKVTPKKKVIRCKRKYYWKNHKKRWRCVR